MSHEPLSILIPGPPVGWRIGYRIMPGRLRGERSYVHTHLVTKADEWQKTAIVLIKAAARGRKFPCHVAIEVVAVYARPGRLNRQRDKPGRLPIDRQTKPDATNVQKLAEDSLSKAGLIADDSLTNQIHTRRWIAAKDEYPHVLITIGADPALEPLSLFSDATHEE